MGSSCYYCGEKFGRCAEHAGSECPPGCGFGRHDCPGDGWDGYGDDGHDLVIEAHGVVVSDEEPW